MADSSTAGIPFGSAIAASVAVTALFMKADDVFSKEFRDKIASFIQDSRPARVDFSDWISFYQRRVARLFSARGVYNGIMNTLWLSFASVVLGIAYYSDVRSLNLFHDTDQAVRMATMIVVHAVVPVGLSMYFSQYALRTMIDGASWRRSMLFCAVTLVLTMALFAGLLTLVYSAAAIIAGSLGGDVRLAVLSVGPTLRDGIHFRNVSGAYFYAAAVFPVLSLLYFSLYPLLNALLNGRKALSVVGAILNVKDKPIQSIGILLGVAYFVVQVFVSTFIA